MESISLKPLINIFEKYHYKIYEDNENFVLMDKESEQGDIIDKIMIPKSENNIKEYISIINIKFDRLIRQEENKDFIENLEMERDILLADSDNHDKISIRIKNTKDVVLDRMKKIINKFSNLAQRYWDLIWDSEFSSSLKFLQTSKWSFVVNISLPDKGQPLFEEFNRNDDFVCILKSVSENKYDFINNKHWWQEMKQFCTSLKEFLDDVLWDTELYYTTDKSLTKIVNTITKEEKDTIYDSLKEIEENILNPIPIEEKNFMIIGTTNWIGNRISSVKLTTSLDNQRDYEFNWSWLDNDDLSYIKKRDADDQDIILRNIKCIKLKDYYRILSAEVVKE